MFLICSHILLFMNLIYCEEYVTFKAGGDRSKIIINVPNGGSDIPEQIPDRTCHGCYISNQCVWNEQTTCEVNERCKINVTQELYTKEIALEVIKEFEEQTSLSFKPFYIANELHRKKMDGNRDQYEATCNKQETIEVYENYHGRVRSAATSIQEGLFLDFHAQFDPKNRVQLGYLISKTQLNENDINPQRSSLLHLSKRVSSFERVLRGDRSLGGYLQIQGIGALPSLDSPSPGNDEYTSGGFSTMKYSSGEDWKIDAIHVGIPSRYRNEDSYKTFAKNFAKALKEFMDENYPSL